MFLEAHAKKQSDAKATIQGFQKKEEETKNPTIDTDAPVTFLPPKAIAFAPKIDADAMKKL